MHVFLLNEACVSSRFRVISAEGRAFLDAKLHPRIFASPATFASFVLPLAATAGLVQAFFWPPARLASIDSKMPWWRVEQIAQHGARYSC